MQYVDLLDIETIVEKVRQSVKKTDLISNILMLFLELRFILIGKS